MSTVEIIYGLVFISLGILTSWSDLKEGRVYNKILLIFGIISLILNAVYYGYYAKDLIPLFMTNFVMIIIVSLILFYSHSLAGGDCKLIMIMGLLYPADYYLVYRNSTMTLFFALGSAIFYGYVYLLYSAIYSMFRGINKITKKYVIGYIWSFIETFISATVYIGGFNLGILYLYRIGIAVNVWFIRILCIIIARIIAKYKCLAKWYVVMSIFLLDLIVGYCLKVVPFSINPENYILVVILLICQATIRTNLYKEIPVSELEKGMILSTVTSMYMQNSKTEGLPAISAEDLRSRLTESEVNSVKQWAKKGKRDSLVVVKKIPFAIFIFMGFISYFVIWMVVKWLHR